MSRSSIVVFMAFFASLPSAHADDLLTIYQQALGADPQLRSAEIRVDIGSAQKGQALGQMLPQVSGTANWSTNSLQVESLSGQSYKGTRYFIALSQTLVDFGKFWDWRKAQDVVSQYEAELLNAQQTLMFNVVQRYFGVLDAEDQLRLIQSEKSATESELEQVKKQYAKQLIKITDLLEAEARLDQLSADEIQADSALTIAKQALRELTDSGADRLDRLQDGVEYNELEGDLDEWIAIAKSENPVMTAQKSAVDAASNDVVAQKSRHLPVVDLQLNYFDTDTGFQSVPTNHTQTQVAAINVNVPIFSGGTIMHRAAEAESRLEITKEEGEAKSRALVKETSDAFTASNANARRIRASEKALMSASKSREAMQTGLKYGVQTVADVLRAQQLEFKAKRELSRAKYEYVINRVRFLKAIGTIGEDNLREINDWLTKS